MLNSQRWFPSHWCSLPQLAWSSFRPGGAKNGGTQSWRPGSRARLVVLALEVGGRWSAETRTFVAQTAKAKARREPRLLQKRAEQAWRMQWGGVCGGGEEGGGVAVDLFVWGWVSKNSIFFLIFFKKIFNFFLKFKKKKYIDFLDFFKSADSRTKGSLLSSLS